MEILHFLPFKLKTRLVIGLLFLFKRLINYFLIIKKATVWWVRNKFFWRKALLLDIVIHCEPLQKYLTKHRNAWQDAESTYSSNPISSKKDSKDSVPAYWPACDTCSYYGSRRESTLWKRVQKGTSSLLH